MAKQLNEIIKSKQWLESEQEYRDYPAINYSTLSNLDKDPLSVDREFVGTDATLLGSIVDCMLTGGNYDDDYVTAIVNKPAGMQGDLVDILFTIKDDYLLGDTIYQNSLNSDIVVFKDMFEEAYKRSGLKTPKLETATKNFLEKGGKEYYDFLHTVGDKTVVSLQMKFTADEIVKTLKTNEFTKDYFTKLDNEDYQIYYQVPLVFNLPASVGEHKEGKVLIDILLVNHKDKCITPVDLKTTSDKATNFNSAFIKWKYYLQASYYSYGLGSLTDYEVLPFRFVVASTTDVYRPLCYKVSQKTLAAGRFGIRNPMYGYFTKGWEQLSQELIYLQDTGNNQYPKEVYDNKGCLTLDNFDLW
jgi:hypothetical protein